MQKRLLKEELRRRRKTSRSRRLLLTGILFVLVLGFAAGGLYLYNLDRWLEADFQRAEDLVAQGKYTAAESAFRRIYEHHPDFRRAPEALFQAGQVLNLYLKRYPDALLSLLLVEKDYPESPQAEQAQRQVAEIYKYRLREFAEAVVAYQKLLDDGAADGDRIQYEIADAYFRLGNFEQARIEFESLLKNWPASPLVAEVRYRIATAYALDGDLEAAEKAYRGMLKAEPDSSFASEARFALAGVLEEQGKLLDALKILEALKGVYANPEVLRQKTEQVEERIRKKRKAI